MKSIITAILLTGVVLASSTEGSQGPEAVRDQDLGAYSREATDAARARLKDTVVVVFAGGRHGFIQGQRVPLDPANWRTEAEVIKSKVMVPKRFALSAFGIKRLPWFGFRIAQKGKMVSIADLARRLGKQVFTEERGLVIVSEKPVTLNDSSLLDSIITLFDTPEKFADPQIAFRNIPRLKAWGRWAEHVAFTPEQLALYDYPQMQWRLTAEKRYEEVEPGMHELASEVPPPGVHPRVLFSPQDLPLILVRIKSSVTGAMSLAETAHLLETTWLDAGTSDGQLFARLVAGELTEEEILGQLAPQGMQHAPSFPTNHITRSLNAIALYALLTDDDDLGKKVAGAISNYYEAIASALEAYLNQPEVYSAYWCEVPAWIGPMDLGLNYDFAARWMTPEQSSRVRGVIARLVSGRRGYGQNGPLRVRDNHWVTRDLTLFLANLAIEGEDGFDEAVHECGVETVKAFLQWGIDEHGTLYQSNGTSGAGLQFQLLSMVALARRDVDIFGHPHWRKLMESQVQCTSPDRQVTGLRGMYGSEPLNRQIVTAWKILYPNDRCADYLLGPAPSVADFDPQRYRQQLVGSDAQHLALTGPTSAGLGRTLLYDAAWRTTTREELDLPLDFSDAAQGLFSARSDHGPEALWINMQARPDLYLGAGPTHHDAGSFYLQSHGVTWGREGLSEEDTASRNHSVVLIDGVGQDDGTTLAPPRVKYLGAAMNDDGAVASADLRYAYEYLWTTKVDDWGSEPVAGRSWELETDSSVVEIFKGTQRYRINYWASPLHNPWLPTLRARFNSMAYAFRSAGLIRGAHPYAIVIDDICKDENTHVYTWQMMGAFRTAGATEIGRSLGSEMLILTAREEEGTPAGSPMLLVREVGPSACRLENADDRTRVVAETVECRFRILLVPFRMGEEVPRIDVDAYTGNVEITWSDQSDELEFEVGKDNRTRLKVSRDDEEILQSK